MNDRARGLLVKAALDGVRQIPDRTHDGYGGFCAGGVLLADAEARGIKLPARGFWPAMKREYGIGSLNEWREIVDANRAGRDFLHIADKCGVMRT